MSQLTKFQVDAKRAISNLLESKGENVVFSEMGNKETYLFSEVRNGLRIWIYEDELQLECGSFTRLMEKPDFPDPDDMIARFVDEVDRISGTEPKL